MNKKINKNNQNSNKNKNESFRKKKQFNSSLNSKIFKDYHVPHHYQLMEFLIDAIPSKSRNNIKHLLSNKQVLVNGAPVSQFDFTLLPKDVITISPTPIRKGSIKDVGFSIIYEDDELIVVNKPASLLVVADDKEKEKTLYRIMMDYCRKDNPKNRIYVVHRLDKETSGVIIFSKSEELKDALQDKWNDLVSTREYIAVCNGIFDQVEGTRVSYLMQTKTNLMYSTKDTKNGSKAITHYKVLKTKDNYSLVQVKIDTGRKNQIRVHMKDLSHPIVGDDKYNQNEVNNPFSRLGLHARVLEFDHPLKNKHFKFIADTPKEFLRFFDVKKVK